MIAPSELRVESDEHEENRNGERPEIIEITLIDEEKDKVSIDMINEKHFTTEEHNVDRPKTVAIIENTNLVMFSNYTKQICCQQAVISTPVVF